MADGKATKLGMEIAGFKMKTDGFLRIFVHRILPDSPIGLDGTVEIGDILIAVNGISLENLTNSVAVNHVLRHAINSGHVILQIGKPVRRSVNGQNPGQRQCQRLCTACSGTRYGTAAAQNYEDMAPHGPVERTQDGISGTLRAQAIPSLDIVSAMQDEHTGLEIRSRKWLKMTLRHGFLGFDMVNWLYRRVHGFEDRKAARKYAQELLNSGYIYHQVPKMKFSEHCYYGFVNDDVFDDDDDDDDASSSNNNENSNNDKNNCNFTDSSFIKKDNDENSNISDDEYEECCAVNHQNNEDGSLTMIANRDGQQASLSTTSKSKRSNGNYSAQTYFPYFKTPHKVAPTNISFGNAVLDDVRDSDTVSLCEPSTRRQPCGTPRRFINNKIGITTATCASEMISRKNSNAQMIERSLTANKLLSSSLSGDELEFSPFGPRRQRTISSDANDNDEPIYDHPVIGQSPTPPVIDESSTETGAATAAETVIRQSNNQDLVFGPDSLNIVADSTSTTCLTAAREIKNEEGRTNGLEDENSGQKTLVFLPNLISETTEIML